MIRWFRFKGIEQGEWDMYRFNKPILFCLFLMSAFAHAQNTFPATGNVGIGTASPTTALQIGTPDAANTNRISIPGVYNFENVYLGQYGNGDSALEFVNHTNLTQSYGAKLLTSTDAGANGLQIQVAPVATSYASLSYSTAMTILAANGNVGIGTTSPSYAFDVTGKIRSTAGVVYPDGTLQTTAWTGVLCGGDYAESVDVTGTRVQYEPGDVMVVDSHAPGNFHKSAEPYSTLAAGIYSTKPGAVGRRSTDPSRTKDEIPMAMIGIVPTKVSAENGPVMPGDLLVTSSTPGYAMRGTDRDRMTGAIVGKALGSVQRDKGTIEVLVTLQ
jgi:hypothetical protein